VRGYLSPPTTKVTEVGKNYFKVNISITALDNICKRKNEKMEIILLHSKVKTQTYNASLLYCTYHLKNEARNLFPKKLIKKIPCSNITQYGSFTFHIDNLEPASFYCIKIFYQAFKGLELLKSENSYAYVTTKPPTYNHEVLIVTITGTVFCIVIILGYKFMKNYKKFRKLTIVDKENKNKGFSNLQRTLLQHNTSGFLDTKTTIRQKNTS